jgi:hypothetical protein
LSKPIILHGVSQCTAVGSHGEILTLVRNRCRDNTNGWAIEHLKRIHPCLSWYALSWKI